MYTLQSLALIVHMEYKMYWGKFVLDLEIQRVIVSTPVLCVPNCRSSWDSFYWRKSKLRIAVFSVYMLSLTPASSSVEGYIITSTWAKERMEITYEDFSQRDRINGIHEVKHTCSYMILVCNKEITRLALIQNNPSAYVIMPQERKMCMKIQHIRCV